MFYSLRHSYISRALGQGVPTKAVADHCGTSILMLQRFYAKFIPGDQQRYAAMAAPAITLDQTQAKSSRLASMKNAGPGREPRLSGE